MDDNGANGANGALKSCTTKSKTKQKCLTRMSNSDQCNNSHYRDHKQPLRINSSSIMVQSRQRRIVAMLCVVVIEFFVCWTPILIMDTLSLYIPDVIYGCRLNMSKWIKIDLISVCHLIFFCSSCTNPVTYCFMNRRFRRHFFSLFHCRTGQGTPNTKRQLVMSNVTNEHPECNNQTVSVEQNNNRIGGCFRCL